MIYFTADLHLGHNAIIGMQDRPFATVEQMNKALIDNYNAVVRKNDTVYILGDICHRVTVDKANEFISKLNGKKILIKGNHDKVYDPELFEDIGDFMTISMLGHTFAMMHYPMLSWPKSHHGSFQLHGHVHSREADNEMNRKNKIRRYDVGVDANNYYPVTARQILDFFGTE